MYIYNINKIQIMQNNQNNQLNENILLMLEQYLNKKNKRIKKKIFEQLENNRNINQQNKIKRIIAIRFNQTKNSIRVLKALQIYYLKLKKFQEQLSISYYKHILRKYFLIVKQNKNTVFKVQKENKKIKIEVFTRSKQMKLKMDIFNIWKDIYSNKKKYLSKLINDFEILKLQIIKNSFVQIKQSIKLRKTLKNNPNIQSINLNYEQSNYHKQIQFSRKYAPIKTLTKRLEKTQTIPRNITPTKSATNINQIKSRNITPIKPKEPNLYYNKDDSKFLQQLLIDQDDKSKMIAKLIYLKLIQYQALNDCCFSDQQIFRKHRIKLEKEIKLLTLN